MKPSPKKSVSSRLKQRTKSTSNVNSSTSASAISNNVANNTSSHSQSNKHQSSQQQRSGGVAGGSDTNSSGNDATPSSISKDKSSYKSYAGFSSRSVKTIWEQHDKQETEVVPDVYNKLSEDTTYKLWELVNNIKTYSRHAAGKVTYELVNEVLKDCDIPPIVGANNESWDKIEYDGVYFFNSDEVLDLREEYIKDVTMEQSNIPVMTTSWMAESAIAEDLLEMYNNVCDAVYLGDEECFEEAIQILTHNPHVPSLMKLLLTKAIEMLGFEYTENTLVRSLQFLEALVQNDHVSHSDLTLELSLLSQIFVNLLLGAINLMQTKFIPAQPMNLDLQPQSQISQHQQPHSIPQNGTESSLGSGPPSQNNMEQLQSGFGHSAIVPINILDNNLPGPSEDSNNSNSNATEELLRSIENIKEGPDGIDINNIKDEYEALFSMVQGLGKQESGEEQDAITVGDGFHIKAEFGNEFDANAQNFMVQQGAHTMIAAEGDMNFEIKQEGDDKIKSEPIAVEDPDENISLQMSESTNGEIINPNSTTLESENITTLICNDYLVDEVCRVIGLCASKWGFVEQECTFLLVERLQRYFDDKKHDCIDYNWLSRMLRGLWSVGEFAFREMCPYFELISTNEIPVGIYSYLNCTGMFLRGKRDIYLYEYLNDVCGDGLLPFIFQYEHYIERKHQEYHRLREGAAKHKNHYKIAPKVLLKVHPKPTHLKPPPTINDLFPERVDVNLSAGQPQQPAQSRFNFRFAGCRPVSLKTGKNRAAAVGSRLSHFSTDNHEPGGVQVKQNETLIKSFQGKVVIARRKLLTPDTNLCQPRKVYCYGSTVW